MTPTVQQRAVALLAPGQDFAFATDASADPVLLAIARPNGSLLIEIDRSEYGMGLELANLLGFPPAQPKPAIERIRSTR